MEKEPQSYVATADHCFANNVPFIPPNPRTTMANRTSLERYIIICLLLFLVFSCFVFCAVEIVVSLFRLVRVITFRRFTVSDDHFVILDLRFLMTTLLS